MVLVLVKYNNAAHFKNNNDCFQTGFPEHIINTLLKNSIYVYVCVYMVYICVCVYIYIYTYIYICVCVFPFFPSSLGASSYSLLSSITSGTGRDFVPH